MTGIIVSTPPTVEVPPGNNANNPSSLPPVTYTYALLSVPQTWTAKQTFSAGNIALNASDITGLATSATVDTSNASNISSGTLGAARLPAVMVRVYDTVAALAADATVDTTQTVVRTRGKLAIGDFGGATYLQVASDPAEQGSFALASGRFVKLLEPTPTPQMFKLSTDAGNDALMFNRFFTYVTSTGSDGLVPPLTYAFSTQVSITAPSFTRSKVRAPGATFTTTGAIYAFAVTGGGYSGGMTFEDFTINAQGNASAFGGWRIQQSGNITLVRPIIKAGLANPGTYKAIYLRQSNIADSSTGAFWTTIEQAQIYSTTTDHVPFGIVLEGSANRTRIIGGALNTFDFGIYIDSTVSPSYGANGVIIDGVDFEIGTQAIRFVGVLGDTNSRVLGLKITNCTAEGTVPTFLFFQNCNQVSESPPYLAGNYVASATYISNANNIRVLSYDYPLISNAAVAADADAVVVDQGSGRVKQTFAAIKTWIKSWIAVADLNDVAWTTYTPTITSGSGTITTASATGRYKKIGKKVDLQILATITTAGTGAGQLKATLPINAAAFSYAGIAKESALTGKSGAAQILGATDATVVQSIDSAGVTFIASGGAVNFGITYEIP